MYWNTVLQEVLNKHSPAQKFSFTPGQDAKSEVKINAQKKDPRNKVTKKIFLGLKFPSVYFTRREAEVMIQLLHGKTVNGVADFLSLSPRTIEYYVKNMKAKLRCRTKSELIGKVFCSDFIKNVDFFGNLVG